MRTNCFLLIYLFSITTVSAQWTVLNSGVTDSLRSVYFLNANLGWACGAASSGTCPILKTTDGGTTWSVINHPTMYELRGIQFMDPDTGIIVGFHGTILRSTNGGTTWDSIASGTTRSFRSVHFPSHDTGYACGGGATVLKTTDAGLTWIAQSSGTTGELVNIRFLNNDVGYAVRKIAGSFLDGYIIKTIDGGVTWSTIYTNPDIGLFAVAVCDDSTAYAGGNNQTILKTSDGGVTWNQVYEGITDYTLRGAAFLNADTGWIAGGTNGAILYTDDGGITWINQDTITGIDFLAIHFPGSDVGYAVGTLGTILKYNKPCLPLAFIDSVIGETSVCANDTVTYVIDSIPGISNYVWQVPGDAIISTGNGGTSIYVVFGNSSGYISVSASNQCDTFTGSLAVTVNPLPVPNITFGNDTLKCSPASIYQWYHNGSSISGATGQTYVPTQNGSYAVTVFNAAGCEGSSLPFNVIALHIHSGNESSFLEIFPNPFLTSAVIILNGSSSSQLLISDMQGRIIREITVDADDRILLNKKDFTEGMFFISLMNDRHQLIARCKLVVQ